MKNKSGFELKRGTRVRVSHPRGGHSDTRVNGFERMPGYGIRVLLANGLSAGPEDCAPIPPPTLTEAQEAERAQLRARVDAFEVWRAGRASYRSEEVPPGLAVENAELSRLETLDFIASPPERYFAYVKTEPLGAHGTGERIRAITTWTGETLANVTWEGPDFRDSLGGVRVNFRCVGINGRTYSGTYFKSARSYCRMKQTKGNQ